MAKRYRYTSRTQTIIVVLIMAIVFFVYSTKIQAQINQRTSLSITPPLSEIMIKPGKSITQAFTVKNEGTVDLEVTPSIVDFSPEGESGHPIVLPNNRSFPFAQLQNLDKALDKPFVLQKGTSEQLVVRIAVPEQAEEKDYYQTLLLSTKPINLAELGSSTSTSYATIGVHMLISVSKTGMDLGSLNIQAFRYPKIVDVFSPVVMELVAKNNGKTYTKAHGEVSITSFTGTVVKLFPILPENVLAGSMRRLHASLPDPEDNKNALSAEFEYRPIVLFGPYTITVKLFSEQQQPEERNYSFVALPISPALFLGALYITIRIVRKKTKPRV